uniref:Uncharacterized protein n=1 Tax=Arundo donax TaxID=35708 RepID=A0A0A9AP96_ARUDO
MLVQEMTSFTTISSNTLCAAPTSPQAT